MNLLYVTFKYLSMGNCRHFMTKTRFGIRYILNVVCAFGDIWGSIGVCGVGNNIVRNKGEGCMGEQ